MSGHILIKDKETGEEITSIKEMLFYGNMARIVGQALNNVMRSKNLLHGFP